MTLKKLTSTYPIVPEDFDLSLKIRMTEAFAKMSDELLASAKSMPAFGGSMPRITPRMMAHPVAPWPFGTVIRPSATNADFKPSTRHMLVGLSPSDRGAVIAIDLHAPIALNGYTHLLSNLADRWEPVPESEP